MLTTLTAVLTMFLAPTSLAMRSHLESGLVNDIAGPESGAPSTPKLEEVADCGGAHIKAVGSKIGCGQDGCAWVVTSGDDKSHILKVARPSKASQASVVKDCKIAQGMQKAGVERALQCLGMCTSGGDTAAVLSPFLKGSLEFHMGEIRLHKTVVEHAVVETIKTALQMLHSGYVNVDQANNVLYDPQSGDPLFIDFGRAQRVTKPLTGFAAKKLTFAVSKMLVDLIWGTVPRHLCSLAKTTVHELLNHADTQPAALLAPDFAAAMTTLETSWEKASC